MTLKELTDIILETINETEDDLHRYADLAERYVSVTVQVMDVLKGIAVEMSTRDLKHALLVQKIVGKVRARSLEQHAPQPAQRDPRAEGR